MKPNRDRIATGLLTLAASIVAIASARSYADSANDGSRLATVQSLVDHRTLAIDDSIFVRPPPTDSPRPLPYALRDNGLPELGTCDKVRIHGRFYSHQPPVPAVLMAGVYGALKWCCGLDARARTDWFCYLMTLTSCGLAYVASVFLAYRMGRTLRLSIGWSVTLAAILGLATVAPAYTRHVNGHILLLPIALCIFERLAACFEDGVAPTPGRLLLIGSLAGLGYAVEQVAGLFLLVGTLGVIVLSWPSLRAALLALAAAAPWVVMHHALVFAIAGTLRPMGSVPEYFDYPGSDFDATNMTGRWNHAGLFEFLYYAGGLLFGYRGFLQSNLPIIPAVLAAPLLLRRAREQRTMIVFAIVLCLGTWLVYAALSNNYAGICCSIRWFVPLLAPGLFLLALLFREYPASRQGCLVLAGFGVVLAVVMWDGGPWASDIAGYWWITGTALAAWLGMMAMRWRRHSIGDVISGSPSRVR